jgi:hypothetical protein
VLAIALLMSIFGLYAGWHWKLMHRSFQDVNRVKRLAKGQIPELTKLRSHHTVKAFWIFVVAVVIIFVAVHH